MIRSELDEKNNGCNVAVAGSIIALTQELGAIFEGFSENRATKSILLSVIDSYLGKQIKDN